MEQPTPRVALGIALRGIATAAIDVSDGLIGDLGHILQASRVGATLNADDAINLIAAYAHPAGATALFDLETWRGLALSGGDDYELVFTAAPTARDAVMHAGQASGTPVARIGAIESAPGLRIVDALGVPVAQRFEGFDHFAADPPASP
jgi:thiamine-monophosphate kinase